MDTCSDLIQFSLLFFTKEIRNKINPHTVTLLTALNEFIDNSKTVLDDSKKLVVIVDNFSLLNISIVVMDNILTFD
jgi:hypothetical protein